MRSLKSGLLVCATAAFLGSIAVAGCSADGASDDSPVSNANPTESGSQLPPSSSPDDGDEPEAAPAKDAGKKDAGSKDASKVDAAKDAAPPAPATGSTCATPNEVFKRTCGFCGQQTAICLAGENGDPNKVSDYGACLNQVDDGCIPGSIDEQPCGNCGTMKRTCTAYCHWNTATCTGEPVQSCTPGSVELLTDGCAQDLYRQKTCKDTCTWDNVTPTCSAAPTFVVVPPNAGSVSSTVATLSSAKTTKRLSGYSCPLTSWPSTSFPPPTTPYTYIEVKNTQPKAVTTTIYTKQATGGGMIHTVLAAYPGTTIPTTETARRNCKSVASNGPDALTGNYNFAALDDDQAVTIPANSSVMVYVASFDAYDATKPSSSTGPVKFLVRTDSVAP